MICCKCGKEFTTSAVKMFIYNTYNETDIECDRCIFDNVFSKIEEDFKINVYNELGNLKSLQWILDELSIKYNEI